MTESSAADVKANAGSEWDIVEEVQPVETKAEPTETKPEDDAAREEQIYATKLGRKVKDQSVELENLKQTNQQLLEAMSRLESHLSERGVDKRGDVESRLGEDLYDQMCQIEPPPVEFVTTPKEQVLMDQWSRRTQKKLEIMQKATYEKAYIRKIDTLKAEGGELHEEIARLLVTPGTPYNVTRGSGRGDVDAELNYAKALNALISGKEKPARTLGTTGNESPKAGVTAQSISSTTGTKATTLSGEAAEYAKYLGFTDEQIAEAMDRPIITK